MAETAYDLMHGQSRLGTLQLTENDQPWFRCTFSATTAFDSVRPLFAAEIERLERPGDEHWDEWEAAYRRIEELGLRIVPQDGEPVIDDFLLHIDGDVAWFRY